MSIDTWNFECDTNDAEDKMQKKGQQRRLVDHLYIGIFGILLPVLPVQNCPSILIQLDRRDNNIAGMDTNGGSCAIGLVALNPVNMDDPFFAVDLGDFAFPAFVFATHDADLVVLSNG